MQILKQSTASQAVVIGPFVDSTDGVTAETGLTIANTDIRLSKNGGNIVAKNSGGGTHDEGGFYTVTLDATDTNTVGRLQLYCTVSGALPVYHEFTVIEEQVYETFYASGADLETKLDTIDTVVDSILVDTAEIGSAGAGLTALATQASVNTIDSNVDAILADTATDGVAISASTINAIADHVWDEPTSGHVAAGSFGAVLAVVRSATAQAGGSTTITLDASASSIDDAYNNMQIEIVSGTGAGNKEFITDYNGTTKVATVSGWTLANPSSDSVFVIRGFGTLPGASAPTASQVADAVWDEPAGDHTSSGSFGQVLGGSILDEGTAQAGGSTSITLDSGASATNNTYQYDLVRIISGTGAGQSRQISAYVGSSKVATVSLAWATNPSSDSVYQVIALGVDAATVSSIADGVWDEARAGHVGAGTFGERVNANMTQISGDTNAADNLESYCDGTTPQPVNMTQISGDAAAADALESYCDGTTPQPVNATQLSGDATAADNLEALLDGTGGITLSGDLSGSVANVTGGIDTASGTITTLDGLDTALDAAIATLNDLSASDVNAQVLDVLNVDVFAEPTGVPAASASIAEKVGYVYMALRNRIDITANKKTFYDDSGAAEWEKDLSDNGTTYSESEGNAI